MDVTGKPEDTTSGIHLYGKLIAAFQRPASTFTKFFKIFVVSTSAAGLIACTPTAPEFEDIGSSTYAKPTTDQELYLISDLTSNSPAISGSCDDNTVSIGMKPDGQEAWDEVATSSLDPSSDLNCIDGNFSLVISQAGTYMGFTLSLAEQKKIHIKTTGANGDSAETEAMIRYLPVIPIIDVVDISPSSNEGQTATLRLTIYPQATFGAVFNYQTLDISAAAGSDYTSASGSVSFGTGDDFLDVPIVIATDSLFEADETFKVSLDSVAGANFGASEATVTIPTNGTPPSIFIGDATGSEGDTLTFTISINAVSGVNATFNVDSFGGTAGSGTDFTAISTSGSIPAGSLTATVDVVTTEETAYESDETFTVSLSSVVNASVGIAGSDDVGTGTIQNDDTQVNIYLTAPAPSAEGGDHVFTVSVSATSVFNVTYAFDTYDGTATTADSDYTALSGMTGTLMAGDLSQTITVVSGNDSTFENDETVVLSLSSVLGAIVGAPGTDDIATATILNNDSGPSLFIDDLSLNEGVSGALSVSLDSTSGIDAVFTWQTFDGSALASNSDYTSVGPVQITIPSGSLTTGLVYVEALGDSLDEANENLTITLAVVSGAGTGDLSSDITINDQNGPPNVFISDSAEPESNNLAFLVSLDVVSGQDVAFSYQSYDGTATTGDSDYSAVSGTATIPALQDRITLSVSLTDDNKFEVNEFMSVTISSPVNGVISDNTGIGTLQNNDSAPQLFIGDSSVTEGQTLAFVVSITAVSGVDMSFDYQSFDGNTGTVTLNALVSDSDYSVLSGTTTIAPGDLSVTLLSVAPQDTKLEGDEQMTVSLDNISGATIVSAGTDDVATGTISNDDAFPFIYSDDLTYGEGSTGQHVVSLSEVSGLPVEFSYTVYNGSVIGADYNVVSDSTLTIAAGSITSSVDIDALVDGLDEDNETYTLSLHSLLAAQDGDLEAAGTITDGDPTPSIYITDENISEPGTSTVTVSLSEASGREISFSYQSFATGSATGGGTDYNDVALTVATISAGATSFTFSVEAVGDALAEGNEVFDVSLSGLNNVNPGDISGTMTILDDDGPPNLTVYPVEVTEGSSGIALASLSATSGLNVTFDWQTYDIPGEAVAGSDYTAQASVEYTIAAGQLTVGLTITATNDSPLDEEDFELLVVSLSNLSNANFAVSIATVSISDADTPPDIFVANAAGVTEGSTLQFSITLSKISGRDVIVDWQTVDGVASVVSGDYTAVSSQLATFSPGTGTITAEVRTLDDSLDEAVESVLVSLTSATSGNISDPSGSGDINDDDPLVQISAFDAQATEGTSAVVTISLNTASGRHVSFDFDLQDGSATSGSGDYPAGSGTLTIYTSDTFMLLTIPTSADASFESDEVFHISLSNPVAATFADDFADITLINGNAPPGIYVSDAAGPITEGTNADFVVSLSGVSGLDVTFDYETYDDTALGAYDFTAIGTTEATIPAGQLNITLSVNTTDDLRDDSAENEFFGITITSPTNGNISVASGQVMIQDNDLAPNLYVVDLGGNEGETLSVVVSLSEESERNVTFDYETYDGSATVTADFLGRNETGVQFAPYTTSLSVAVTLVADSLYEDTDETFVLSLTPSTDAGVGGDLEATLTVTNTNALPQLFAVNSASVTEGTTAEFLVTMSGQASTEVTFLWSTIDGWAQDSGIFIDYVGVTNKIVTISPLSTGITLATDTNDDGIGEPAENFFVTLTGASANATIVGSSAQITLNDNDGGVYLMVYGDTQDEGTDLVFTVSKSSNQPSDVTFNVETFDATAISMSGDNDYTGISRTGTIAGGLVVFDMIATFTISTGNDTKLENNETFVLSISNVNNASVATPGSDDIATGTINNNDFQPMLFVDNLNLNEGETQVLSVSLSEVSGLNSIFNWETFNGSAAEGAGDYTQVTTTQVTIPAGSVTTHLVSFSALSDGLDEFDEYAYVSLTAGLNVSVGNDGVDNLATVTIVDQDAAPSIYVSDVSLSEANDIQNFVVSLNTVSAKVVTFDYASSDVSTATGSGTDFVNFSGSSSQIAAGVLAVTISGPNSQEDSVYEGNETYFITLTSYSNSSAGNINGVATIYDNETTPNLVVYGTSISEGVAFDFIVSMSGENSTQVTFDFDTFNDTAVQPNDYTAVSRQYTIAAGGLEATVPVNTIADFIYENTEQILVSISNDSANVTILTAGATGTIVNGDPVPYIIVDDNLTINEGDTGEFIVSLTAVSEVDAVFSWQTHTISGQAEAGDFTIVNATTATVPAGASAVTVSVFTSQDVLDEANEDFMVSLSTISDVGVNLVSDIEATGTIIDDDGTPNIFATDITITEGDATYMTVSLAASLGYDVTFDFATVNIGSAVNGTDFVPMVGGQMTITSGNLTVGVTVTTVDANTYYELDETFHVTISNVSNGASGKLFGVVTIFDNDPMPTISISNGGGNEETVISLDVTLSAQSGVDSVYSVALYDETATAGSGDYLATTGPFTLASFSSNGTVTIATGTDTLFELNETFLVSLHSFSNVTIVTAGVSDLGQATIVNNDAAPTIYIDPVSVNEGETAILPVSLSAVSGLDVVFDWITIDGLTPTLAARSGDLDYFGNGDSNVTIPEGSLTLGLSVITRTDTLDEYDEYFRVSLSSVVNAVGGALDARVTIVDQNSEPQLFISDSAPTLEGATAHFTVSLDATSEKLVTFDYQTFDGTADASDYGAIGVSQGSIPAGSSTFGIAVNITADSVFELTEMFSVSLSNAVHAAIVDDTGLGPINQPGALNISIVESSTGFAAEEVEGTPLVVTVTISSPAQFTVTFDYNLIEISATSADGDYTLPPQLTGVTIGSGFTTDTLTILTGNDTKFEGDEILRVSLSNHPLAVAALTSDINKQLAIQNNDILPELKIDPISAVEGQSANISISLTEVSGFNVTFAFYTNQTGSAVSGLDYYGFNGNLTVVIPAGSTTVPADSVTVAHFDDTEFEGGSGTYETYEVSLMPLFSGAAYFDPATTVSIEDNDTPASLYVGDVGLLTEGDTFPFVVSLSSTPGQDVVFEWSILDGTASVAAGDFTGVTMATATIPNGDLSVTISVISTDDLELESTENFSITVTSLSANAAGVDLDGGGAIFNNDTLSIEFTTSAQSVDEMNGTQPEFRQVVAAGYSHTCALGRDKRSYCWGSNSDKELGFSGVFSLSAPGASSAGDSNGIYRQIGTGWGSTCALGEDQRIYCWGDGLNGRLGVGSSVSNVDAPRQVSLGDSPGIFKKLASGEQFNCAIATNDRLYCWGYNANGQLGDNNAPSSGLTPGLVDSTNGLTTVRDIAAGSTHTCALALDGAAFCWGQGNDGELGNGGNSDSSIPVAVDTSGISVDFFKQISVGRDFSCAIGTDDQTYCWGRNNYGQLGDNNISVPSNVPVLVNSGAGPGTYKSLSLGANHACGVGTDDIPYCWGFGSGYRMGNGSTANQPDPVQVSSGEGPSTYKMIDGGLAHSCGVGTDDNIYCWGGGSYGRLGNGSVTVVEVPALVLEGENTGAAWAEPLVELETILRLTGYYYNDVTLPLTVGGTASNPSDHTAVGGTLTIPSYKTSYSYQYDIVNDGVVEGSETVLFGLGAPSVGSLGAVSSHTATILDDDVGPTIVGVIPPADDTYGDGSSVVFTVTFSELVNVTGSPRLPLSVGASTRYADYSGGSGSAQWTFTYTPSNPDTDNDGIAYVDESTLIDFNGGNVSDSDGNALDIDASGLGLPALTGVLVDTTGPILTIDRISPAQTNVNLITFSFQFNEEIEPSSFTSPDVVITGAGFSFNSINTQIANNLFYVVLNASSDGTVQIGINPGSVDDEAGNPLNSVVVSNDTVTYDASPPNITGITAPPGIYTSGNLNFTLNFDENVIASATNSDLTVSLDGSTYTANYMSGSGSSSFQYQLSVPSNVEEYGGMQLISPLQTGGDTLADAASNNADLTFIDPGFGNITIDSQAPTITDWAPPSNATYGLGQVLYFTVTFSENVNLAGPAEIQFQLDSGGRNAYYDSGSGTNVLQFTYTVAAGDSDTDGITIPSSQINIGGTLQDIVGNNLASNALSVKSTSGILVDSVVPDPCAGNSTGDACPGGALLLGVYDDHRYMVTPSGCTDSTTPSCSGGSESVARQWRGSAGFDADIAGVDNANSAANSVTQSGEQATPAIVIDASVSSDSAADFCSDMTFGGYTDWFLPTKSEWAFMYCLDRGASHSASNPQEDPNCASIGGPQTHTALGFSSEATPYWTATETGSSTTSWTQVTSTGSQNGFAKANPRMVRCIRRYRPSPTIYVSDVSGVEGATFEFVVSLDISGTQNVSFNYTTVDGTATDSGDYTSSIGPATITSGSTAVTISVVTTDDGSVESSETMSLSISGFSGVNVGTVVGTGSISDNDSAPVLVLDGTGAGGGSTLDGVSISSCGGGNICNLTNPYVLTGAETYSSVSLINGAVMTSGAYSGSTPAPNNGILEITVLDTLYVDSTSLISMSGKGYAAGSGSGVGSGHTAASGGGGHASHGGASRYSNSVVDGGGSYGDVTIPDMGSGSGVVTNGSYGANGGGIVKIFVGNLADIDGFIAAEGEQGEGTGSYASGGGAGGSIFLQTVSLSGTGSLAVRGGAGHDTGFATKGGGGSGGRIILLYEENIAGALDTTLPLGAGTLNAYAAGGVGYATEPKKQGGAGTVYYDDTNDGNGAILGVSNVGNSTEYFTPVKSSLDLEALEVRSDARLDIAPNVTISATTFDFSNDGYLKHSGILNSAAAVTIPFNFSWTWDGGTIQGVIPGGYVTVPGGGVTMTFTDSTLTVSSFYMSFSTSNYLTHEENTGTTFNRIDIEASDSIYIGGQISVSGRGNPGGMASVPGTPAALSGVDDAGAAGGSHGGHGGEGTHGLPDKTNYGDVFGGLTLGAGGGSAGAATGGNGGGYIRFDAGNTVELNWAYIKAEGHDGVSTVLSGNDLVGGSGSGGSFEVRANDIVMDANSYIYLGGGRAQQRGSVWGGAGGAGRAYFEYDNTGDDTEIINYTYAVIRAPGNEKTRGAPGPVVVQDNNFPFSWVVIYAGTFLTEAETPLYTDNFGTITLDALDIYGKSNVVIPSGAVLDVDPDSEVYFDDLSTYKPSIIVEGEWANTLTQTGYNLILRNPAATAVNPAANFTVSMTGSLEIDHNQFIDWSGVDFTLDGMMTHSRITGSTVDKMINMRVNDFTVGSSGKISVVGKGFGPGIGPGAGQNAFTNNTSGAGGGHGGGGGDSAEGMAGGIENDNAFAPTLAGSGGGGRFDGSNNSYPDTFGHGGGLVLLDVVNNLYIAGQIDASGADVGSPYTTAGYGGGAGGSISISVGGTFTGFNGYVYADGADCMGGCMSQGGGGGGRIVLPMEDSGSIYVYANGGVTSNFFNGEPGSIYRGPAQLNIQTPYTSMLEPTSLAGISVTLTHTVPYDVTLSVGRTLGTAEDEDFFLHTNTIIISEGQTGGMILVDILDDAIWEGTGAEDVFDISFGWNAPAQVISGAIANSVNITITDNESDVVVYAPTSYLLEEGATNFPVILSLSHLSEAPVNVGYSFTNSNISDGTDYTVVPGPGANAIIFNPGNLTRQLTVNINNDGLINGNRYFSMDYTIPGAGTPISLVDAGSTTIHVNDDDTTSGDVYLLDTVAVEGDLMIFTVTWTGSLPGGGGNDIQLFVSNGTATSPGDFNTTVTPAVYTVSGAEKSGPGFRTFTVQTNSDIISESNEYFTAQINCSSGPSPGAWNSGAKPTAVGTILDQPTIEFEQIWMPVAEGGTAIYVTVETSTGAPLSRSVSFDIVNYSGTAQVGTDYVLPASTGFELPINASSMSIPVQLVDNNLFEFDETFSLSLSNVSGGMAGGLTVLTITIANDDPLDVEPQFPINGRNWMDYVKRDITGGQKWFEASDTACNPDLDDGAGGYRNCIHGGEARVMRTGIDNCTDLKVEDEKGAFTWHCDTSASGYADFYTYELNDGIGLRDLIEGAGSPYLSSLTVSIVGSQPQDYGIASIGARWSNPVIAIQPKGADPEVCQDFDTLGGIHFTNGVINCIGEIDNDKVAVVTGKTGRLRWMAGGPDTCDGSSSSKFCVISADNKDFLWIEANMEAARDRNLSSSASTRAEMGLYLERTKFSVIRNSEAQGAFHSNFRLVNSNSNYVKNSYFSDQSGNNNFYGNVYLDDAKRNLFEDVNISNSKSDGMNLTNASEDNVFHRVLIAGSKANGLRVNGSGSNDNTFKDFTVLNSENHGINLNQADTNDLYNVVIANSNNTGIFFTGGANNNKVTNASIYRTVDFSGSNGYKVAMNTSDNNSFFGDLRFDSGTGSCGVFTSSGAGVNTSCGPANASNFTIVSGLDLSTSFIGSVTIDTANPEGPNFYNFQYSQIDQPGAWSQFESDMRSWGRVGSYTSTVSQGFCGYTTSEVCQINDWNLTDTDVDLKFHTPKVIDGASCPSEFDGSSTIASQIATNNLSDTFFVEAEEISGDGVGDDDGLCESNERCIQLGNRGADQDMETRAIGGACTFSGGTISGVELLSLAAWDVFDNTQIGTGWALNDADLGATSSTANNVRSKTGHDTGKYYVEFVVTLAGSTPDSFGIGLGPAAVSPNESPTGRSDMLMFYDSGAVYDESNTPSYFTVNYDYRSPAPPTVIGLAIDFDSTPTRVWISVNGLYFNGTTWTDTSPNPGQFRDISHAGDLFLFLHGTGFSSGTNVTGRFSPADHQYSAPAGYTAGWPGQ